MARLRKRRMPAAAFEKLAGRGLFWFALPVNVALAALLTGGAIEGGSTWSLATKVAVAVAAMWWWAGCFDLVVLVLYRPRHTRESLEVANRGRSGRVLIPGSRRLVVTTLVMAVLTLALLIAIAVAAEGGWVIFVGILAVGMVVVVLDFAFTTGRPRQLVLSPDGLETTVFRSSASIGWDDIAAIKFVQGMNGAMVFRISAIPAAASYAENWRHPFARRKRVIDVEPIALDLDPLLLALVLRLYWKIPGTRRELAEGQVPARLVDADLAVASVPTEISGQLLERYRPERKRS